MRRISKIERLCIDTWQKTPPLVVGRKSHCTHNCHKMEPVYNFGLCNKFPLRLKLISDTDYTGSTNPRPTVFPVWHYVPQQTGRIKKFQNPDCVRRRFTRPRNPVTSSSTA